MTALQVAESCTKIVLYNETLSQDLVLKGCRRLLHSSTAINLRIITDQLARVFRGNIAVSSELMQESSGIYH